MGQGSRGARGQGRGGVDWVGLALALLGGCSFFYPDDSALECGSNFCRDLEEARQLYRLLKGGAKDIARIAGINGSSG